MTNGQYKEILDVRPEIAKRCKARQIPLNKKAYEALDLLIDIKMGIPYDAKIVSISPRQVREVVAQASIRSGLNRIACPHSLRHTFLSKVYAKKKDIAITQKLAGHSSPATTIGIYVHPQMEDIKDAVKDI